MFSSSSRRRTLVAALPPPFAWDPLPAPADSSNMRHVWFSRDCLFPHIPVIETQIAADVSSMNRRSLFVAKCSTSLSSPSNLLHFNPPSIATRAPLLSVTENSVRVARRRLDNLNNWLGRRLQVRQIVVLSWKALGRRYREDAWLRRGLVLAAPSQKMSATVGESSLRDETQSSVIYAKQLGSRTVILNRPGKLHALDTDMIKSMISQLQVCFLHRLQ